MQRSQKIAFMSVVLVWFLSTQQVSAEAPPKGVLAPRPGGYVFVDCPGVFDALSDEGITVEFWFYLAFMPEDWRERWVLLSRPGSYTFLIRGRRTQDDGWPFDDPEGSVNFSCQPLDRGGTNGPMRNPLNRWRHYAFQFKVTTNGLNTSTSFAMFFDGITAGKGGGSKSKAYLPDDVLFIGGRPGYGSLKGWIDEVRISDSWRYTSGTVFEPERRFRKDEHTLALWHFDEGPWAHQYEDSSGNEYTLFGGETLQIIDQRKGLATTWGRLKDMER